MLLPLCWREALVEESHRVQETDKDVQLWCPRGTVHDLPTPPWARLLVETDVYCPYCVGVRRVNIICSVLDVGGRGLARIHCARIV